MQLLLITHVLMKFYQGKRIGDRTYGYPRRYCSLVRAIRKKKNPWQIGNVLAEPELAPIMVCKLHRRQNPFPTKVPRAFTETLLRSTPILGDRRSRTRSETSHVHVSPVTIESILVFPRLLDRNGIDSPSCRERPIASS